MCLCPFFCYAYQYKLSHLLRFGVLGVGCAHCWLIVFVRNLRGGEVIWKKLKGTLCCFLEGEGKDGIWFATWLCCFPAVTKAFSVSGGYTFSFVWKCRMNALIVLVLLDLLGQMWIVCFSWWKHRETSIRIVEAFCDPFENCRRASCIGCSIDQAWSWKAQKGWIMVHKRNPGKVMAFAACPKKDEEMKNDLILSLPLQVCEVCQHARSSGAC